MRSVIVWSLVVTGLAGCSAYDGDKARKEHATRYAQALQEQTSSVLQGQTPLGYEDCVRLALDRNLDLRRATIEQRIAKLQKGVAFSRFLPALSLNAQYAESDPQILRQIMDMEVAMSDKVVSEISWQFRLSIFNPSTWFLYGLHSRGQEIADLVALYTRQGIVLQTTVLYFQCLSLEQTEKALQGQLAAAEALEQQVAALQVEGVATESQAAEASLQVLSKRTERTALQRVQAEAKARFAAFLGLTPMADLSLKQDLPFGPIDRPLEDLVTEALLRQPRLQIADRQIAIEREKVRLAVANFLPNVMGFANRIDSSDSFLVYSDYWQFGLAGVLNVFDGLANIETYKAAKEKSKEAFIQREQQTLAVMVEVIQAYWDLQTAADRAELTARALDVAAGRLAEVRPKWQEGLVDTSDLLSSQADLDKAQMKALNARFQHQISIATLLNAVGITPVEPKESSHENPEP
ncbi:MAG: TolC family protein [Phycisphaerae bacterium]|nr:TolC family protein [Phycisphaerae bacterium]